MGILASVAMFVPGMLRLGSLRLPVYGVFAAVGLIAALWLSQRTAVLVGLDAEKLWDAGVFGIAAAFVASRVLLVAVEFPAFLKYPLLVLSMPSLTYGGMVFTGVLVWVWLRGKRIPVVRVLDAWAPCACVLAAVLSLGHFVEGTDAGMPTTLPWGVVTVGDSVLGKVHPVQLYGAVLALGLGWWLVRMLVRRVKRALAESSPGYNALAVDADAGLVASVAMVVGGLMAFGLDFLRQPVDVVGGGWLDASQVVALGAVVVGGWLLANNHAPGWLERVTAKWDSSNPRLEREDVANLIDSYVSKKLRNHEELEYANCDDPLVIELKRKFPDLHEGPSCGLMTQEESDRILLDYAKRLREAKEPSGALLANHQTNLSG